MGRLSFSIYDLSWPQSLGAKSGQKMLIWVSSFSYFSFIDFQIKQDFLLVRSRQAQTRSISGLVAEYIVAIDVTRVRFPADAFNIWQLIQTVNPPCLGQLARRRSRKKLPFFFLVLSFQFLFLLSLAFHFFSLQSGTSWLGKRLFGSFSTPFLDGTLQGPLDFWELGFLSGDWSSCGLMDKAPPS